MRLVDADAEIKKIEAEIERYENRVREWKENASDRSSYDVDAKIRELRRNITDCRIEIRCLQQYETVYLENSEKKDE